MRDKIRTAVLSERGGSSLQGVLDARYFGELPDTELCCVIIDTPFCFALERSNLAKAEVAVIERAMFPSDKSFGKAVFDKLDDLDIELVIVADWPYELGEDILTRWEHRILYPWPSLLPAFETERLTGTEIQKRVLAEGSIPAGMSACLLEKTGLPGPVLEQQAVEILQDDTPEMLLRRIRLEAEPRLLAKAAAMFCSGRLCISGKQARMLPEMREDKKK